MYLHFGYNLACEFPAPASVLLMLHLRPELRSHLVSAEEISFSPSVESEEFLDSHGNHCVRFAVPAGLLEIKCRGFAEDCGLPSACIPWARQQDPDDLPPGTLRYLLPSRYCDMEHLSEMAWQRFGSYAPGWERVQRISDWVHAHLRFDYAHARATRTASEAYFEGVGVCRDFTHLAVALCRCLNIPARYVTGYLGDIGVPADPAPMDFSAWMDVYLDGAWHTFDVRHNARRVGHLPIAWGGDAAEVAFITSFGPHVLRHFSVITEEIGADAVPVAVGGGGHGAGPVGGGLRFTAGIPGAQIPQRR